jgi:hypothetical protein
MDEKDEDVGYKKPPRRTRFKQGVSGNPSGKKKGLRSIGSELQDILNETISFRAGDKIVSMSKQRALASALVTAAIDGDLRATAIVMAHLTKESRQPSNQEAEHDDFSAARAHYKRKASNQE